MSFHVVGRAVAFHALEYAQSGVSGHKVGASVEAERDGVLKFFSGCNIELAASMNFHAERVALVKAISEGYTTIRAVYVTSSSSEQQAALCGYCRQDFMYVNPECMIYVFNPDQSLKIEVKLIDTLIFPYLSGPSKIRGEF